MWRRGAGVDVALDLQPCGGAKRGKPFEVRLGLETRILEARDDERGSRKVSARCVRGGHQRVDQALVHCHQPAAEGGAVAQSWSSASSVRSFRLPATNSAAASSAAG